MPSSTDYLSDLFFLGQALQQPGAAPSSSDKEGYAKYKAKGGKATFAEWMQLRQGGPPVTSDEEAYADYKAGGGKATFAEFVQVRQGGPPVTDFRGGYAPENAIEVGLPGFGNDASIGPAGDGGPPPGYGGPTQLGQDSLSRGNVFADIGRFVTTNPELVTGIIGAGIDIYGNIQRGKALDREQKEIERANREREEEARRQREDQNRRLLLQLMSQAPPRY